jgi:hypothetical protein
MVKVVVAHESKGPGFKPMNGYANISSEMAWIEVIKASEGQRIVGK